MAKNLLIVESPAKSATIMKYLGADYEVKASYGHVSDLPRKNIGVDIENNFTPIYEITPEKKKTIAELTAAAKNADKVWIATDEDREGEAIGRHVCNALGLDVTKTARIVFHEITKPALLKAVQEPRTIDMHLVDAQQARRVLDRLVGFELSPVLWKKVKGGLSAGRVQSVAVRLIVDRERDIQKFAATSEFVTVGTFANVQGKLFDAKLDTRFTKKEDAQAFLERIQESDYTISRVETKPGKKSPSAPFTTSTLQQEASRKLGYSVARTMQIAQKLYEAGLITYMRTDSLNMSDTALKAAEQEITSQYGANYAKPTAYKSKSKGAQEAHECIRPTDFSTHEAGADATEKKLYSLIWKRAIASQMAPAIVEKTKADITISTAKQLFVAEGEVVTFDGFLKVYVEGTDLEDEEETGMLPALRQGDPVERKKVVSTETFKKHPPRYTEASLVKEMEKQGIGRPSTYAPTISTIQKREYVVKEDREGEETPFVVITLAAKGVTVKEDKRNVGAEKGKLFPTDMGVVVTDFLMTNFANILDYGFTASVEEEFDEIADGKLQRQKMLAQFYKPFHAEVSKTLDTAERASGERLLGTDPKTGKPVIARIGKFGAMVQIGSKDDEDKPKFSSLRSPLSLETVTLEQALKLFAFPKVLGEWEGKEISAAIGRFGPYIKWDSTFASLDKAAGDLIEHIDLARAIELVKNKLEADKNKYVHARDYDGGAIQVLRGRYGPYISFKKKNYKIPKDTAPEDLTLETCLSLMNLTGVAAAASETKVAKKKVTKKKVAKKK